MARRAGVHEPLSRGGRVLEARQRRPGGDAHENRRSRMTRLTTFLAIVVSLALAPAALAAAPGAKGMTKTAFGKTSDGQAADLYVLTNKNGVEVAITNYGGAVVRLLTPDRTGTMGDIVTGYDDVQGYVTGTPFFGALVGRYANRIGGAKFAIDGKTYTIPANDGPNALHGGTKSFNRVFWSARDVSTKAAPALELTYVSPDGEMGFPGNLTTKVVYTLTDKNELRIDYTATTDKPTVVNLTNHAYFNLTADPTKDILGHQMMIVGAETTPVGAGLIPTGELKSVAGTPFDFRKPTAIGARINSDDEQMKLGRGYDHNWVLAKAPSSSPKLAARVYEPTTGRVLEVLTTEPGLQFYTGNFLDGTEKGKGGVAYQHRTAFCLETQHFPDSPNKPNFPSTELRPGKTFKSTTVYRFSTQK
jgi:aldose 1-epimerase